MSSGEENRHVTTVEGRDISGQIARQNHNKIIGIIKEDQEANNKQEQGSRETVIIAENQNINKQNVEQESIH